MDLLSFDNKTFAVFATCAGVLGLNMIIKAPLTAIQRIKNKAFANPEDVMADQKDKEAVKKQVRIVEDVERVRRAHLNDLENIPVFLALGFLYVLMNPDEKMAAYHFYGYTVARVLHSIMYMCQVPQPSRALCFLSGVGISVSMAVQLIMKGCASL